MAKIKQAKKQAREVPESTWRRLHDEYVEAPDAARDEDPDLRQLAKAHGVPFAEAKQRAWRECWSMELAANCGRRWHERAGHGATNEQDFILRQAVDGYSHVALDGPEGFAHAMAIGRETWRRVMGPVHLWEAHRELVTTGKAYDEARAARTTRRAA